MAQKEEDIVITMSIRHDKNLFIVVTCPLKRSLYLVLINQGNNVDVQHGFRFDIEHSRKRTNFTIQF